MDLYKEFYDIDLPQYPYAINGKSDEFVHHVLESIELEQVQKADQGCIIAYRTGKKQFHAGFALNNRQFIHRNEHGVYVSDIPEKATIYRLVK